MVKNGKIWPVAIAFGIFMVFVLIFWTIKTTLKADLSESDLYQNKYSYIDDNINNIIKNNIAFDKKYSLTYDITLSTNGSKLIYKITTKEGKPVDNAKLTLVISRPTKEFKDIKLNPVSVKNGVYTFENIKLPKEGRWNLLLKVEIGKDSRYYNLKGDTRYKELYEI